MSIRKLLIIAAALFVGYILVSIVFIGVGCTRCIGPDTRRISDVRQIQNGLDLYYKANSKYPEVLKDLIGVSGITNIPKDPKAGWCFLFWCGGNKMYDYAPSSDEQHYVLRAMLEDARNPALRSSAIGILNGLDCTPPAYCVEL